jgi:hypothetical protein
MLLDHTTAGGSSDGARGGGGRPAFATAEWSARLTRFCPASVAKIPYASAATVAYAFKRDAVKHPLNGSGFVVPRSKRPGYGGVVAVRQVAASRAEHIA